MEEVFDEERRRLAREYHNKKTVYDWGQRLLTLGLFIFLYLYSLDFKAASFVNAIFNNRELGIIVFIFLFYGSYYLIDTIFDYIFYYKLNRKYELVNQNSSGWWLDRIKSFLLSLIFIYLAGRLFIFVIGRWPRQWWIPYTIAGSLFIVFLQYILPIAIVPLFFELTPYPETPLKQRLKDLFTRSGVKVAGIYEFDLSSKINSANAAVVGIGNTRKILLGDNLSENFTNAEIEAIMAHEIGHHAHGDIYKNILLQPLIIGISSIIIALFWPEMVSIRGYSALNALASLPLFYIFWEFLDWLLSPLQLAVSRKMEEAADNFALDLMDDPRVFAVGLARIADQSLAQLEYSWYKRWFKASHPAIGERVKKALNY